MSAQAAKTGSPAQTPPLRAPRIHSLPFEVVDSKLRVPIPRSGTVSRTGLVNRLRAHRDHSIATITAPAGYGKTTVLAQWAGRDSRPFAWVSLDEGDNDPVVLLRHLAAAVNAIRPLGRSVVAALAAPGPSIWAAALPRLGSALSAFDESLVVVLDDAHLVRSRDSSEALAAVADHLPDGSVLVLAGRAAPAVPIAALRAAGRLFEVGVDQLALTPREGQLLLRSIGADLTLADVTELVTHCEGWPAALHLTALALCEDDAADRDRLVVDYLRTEYLSRLRPEAVRFLQRTSVLEPMCGGVCDAVLQQEGSAGELEKIERSNLFLVPLDRRRVWYRYNHLFRELLQRELAEREPELVPLLHARAAAWYEAHGDPESALKHARDAGDIDRVAQIVGTIALPAYHSGRVATVEGWFTRFDDPELLARYPGVALQGSLIHLFRGRPEDAEQWFRITEDAGVGSAPLQPWVAAVRATTGRDGVDQMVADAESALAGLPDDSHFRPYAMLALAVGCLLLDQTDRADAVLAEAAAEAERLGATDTRIVAAAERSLIGAARGDHSAAEIFAAEARELAETGHLEGYATSSLAFAVAARASLRHGRWDEARALLAKVQDLRERLVRTRLPWLALQTLIEEARAHLALRDTASVQSVLADTRSLLVEHPDVGVLADQADVLEHELEAILRRQDAPVAGLTAAELRLLPFLGTHLSFREVGEALFVSRNTVKTQAISVYRKLGVTSRSEAITRALELGLVDIGTKRS